MNWMEGKTAAIRFWNTFSCLCKKVEFSRHSIDLRSWRMTTKNKTFMHSGSFFAFYFQWSLLISFLLQFSFLFVFSFPLPCSKKSFNLYSPFLRRSSIPFRLSPWSSKIFPNKALMTFIAQIKILSVSCKGTTTVLYWEKQTNGFQQKHR